MFCLKFLSLMFGLQNWCRVFSLVLFSGEIYPLTPTSKNVRVGLHFEKIIFPKYLCASSNMVGISELFEKKDILDGFPDLIKTVLFLFLPNVWSSFLF